MKRPLLGGHVSAAGGLYKAVENAVCLGAEAIQIFGASPRQWKASVPPESDILRYKEGLRSSEVKSVFLHGAYLVNLATPNRELLKKSIRNLTTHFQIANAIDADGLIFHIGSSRDEDRDKALDRVASGMREVLKAVPGRSKLIMENASGGGGKIGSDIDELAYLFKRVRSSRVGVCLDTAHAFGAGVIDYKPKSLKRTLDVWDKKLGLKNIVVIHANDSKAEWGSLRDRHENIGEGYIGKRGLANLASEKRLRHAPWLLEVPGFDGNGPDKKNLDILRGLF